MNGKRVLQIGGGINFLFVVFHISFWQLFDWQVSLAGLPLNDRAIMQVLNIHTAYILAVFVFLSLAFSNELMTTHLGQSLSAAIAGFWILRAVNQAIFWDITTIASWVIIAVCLGIAILYLAPFLHVLREYKNERRPISG